MEDKDNMKKAVLTIVAICFACIFGFTGCSTSFSGGKTAAPTPKPYPDQDKYDSVLAEGDGYYLVKKYEETYNSAVTKYGIVSDSGEWILPLSESTVFNEANNKYDSIGSYPFTEKSNMMYRYFGEKCFLVTPGVEVFSSNGNRYNLGTASYVGGSGIGCWFFNVETKKAFSFSAVEMTEFEDGVLLFYNDNRYNSPFYSCDVNGNIKELPLTRYVPRNTSEGAFPTLSEGLFYYDRHFYSSSGKMVIDLSTYDLINTTGLHFTNGECSIQFKNPGGTVYYATIDKQGNFLVEPHK